MTTLIMKMIPPWRPNGCCFLRALMSQISKVMMALFVVFWSLRLIGVSLYKEIQMSSMEVQIQQATSSSEILK